MWDVLRSLVLGDRAGEQYRFIHNWPWPHWVAVLLLLVVVSLILGIYARERTSWRWPARAAMALLRCGLFAIVILVMMFGWNLVTDITELPDLVIVVDESASMLHQDSMTDDDLLQILRRNKLNEPSRWNLSRAVLVDSKRALLDKLSNRYRIKLYRIARSVRAETNIGQTYSQQVKSWSIDSGEKQHDASRLGTGLLSILEAQRGRPTAAVMMLTDGITTDGKTISDAALYAKRLNIPLYLVGVGDDRPVRDLRISDLLADDVVFVGDLANFDFRLSGDGFAGDAVKLRLMRADRQELLAERSVTIERDGSPQSVRLSFRPEQVGDLPVRIEAIGEGADVNPGNNVLLRNISVRDDEIRVLYVQEYPSFEYRALKSLLERGTQRGSNENRKAIDLHVVLQEADLEYSAIDASAKRAFPVNRDELFQYDVIIFGDANPAFFSSSLLANISDFVTQRGGGLIFLAGPRHMPWSYQGTPLADLLPVMPEGMKPPSAQQLLEQEFLTVITPQGAASPLIQLTDEPAVAQGEWKRLPPLRWMAVAEELRLGARRLLDVQSGQQTHPLMCMQFVGAGKVVMLLTDETYRWARHPAGEAYYARFWLQMIRYLSRTKLLGGNRLVELTSDKDSYQSGENVRLKVRFLDDRVAPASDDGVTVMLEQLGARRRTVTLIRDGAHRGLFQTELSDLTEGDYRAWVAAPALEGEPPSIHFPIVAQRGELARLELDAADLRQAAEISAGKFYTLHSMEQLFKELPPGRQVRVQTLPPRPLWNAPLWPALFLVLITAEWLLRKKGGML